MAETQLARAEQAESVRLVQLARALGAAGQPVTIEAGKLREAPPSEQAAEIVSAHNPFLVGAADETRAARSREHADGYGRPPRRTQFQPGRSGNPRGRPRGSKNLATIVRQVLDARVAVRENGRVRTITKREALFAQLVHEGLGGNIRAIELLFKIPWIQKELLDLGRSRRLTAEAWDQIALLVRGDLNPQNGSSAEPGVVARRQPYISEVASRLEQAIKARR